MTTPVDAPPAPPEPTRRRRAVGAHSETTLRTWHQTAFSVAVYAVLAYLANRTVWAHGVGHTVQTSGGADVQEEIWFLAQTPWAIVHGVNPLANDFLNTPVGLNLMDNTTMPLLGILGSPITFLWGPIATFNVLIDLAFLTSATACYFMIRRFVSWWPAAFVGGLLYGFSPYAVAEGTDHLFLLFGAIPPLIVLILDRTVRTRTGSPWWGGAALGLCLAAEFYISTENFASVMVVLVLGLTVLGLSALIRRLRGLEFHRMAQVAVSCIVVAVALTGYGAWMAVAGPQHIVGPAQSPSAIADLSTDPVGLIVPTENQQITFGHAGLGDSLVAVRRGNWTVVFDAVGENGTYVGIPLLALLFVGAVVLRRRRIAAFSAVMMMVALILSLGARLHFNGHLTTVPLPFAALTHLPLLNSGIAVRYMGLFWLFAALLLAVILESAYRWLCGESSARRRIGAAIGAVALAVVALFPLIPAWPYASGAAQIPVWFTSDGRALPVGTGVLVYPFASSFDADAMVWQASAELAFKMPGGYAVFAGRAGKASFASSGSVVQEALALCSEGLVLSLRPSMVRSDLRMMRVRFVVVSPSSQGSNCATRLFVRSLGSPARGKGVLRWSAEPRT